MARRETDPEPDAHDPPGCQAGLARGRGARIARIPPSGMDNELGIAAHRPDHRQESAEQGARRGRADSVGTEEASRERRGLESGAVEERRDRNRRYPAIRLPLAITPLPRPRREAIRIRDLARLPRSHRHPPLGNGRHGADSAAESHQGSDAIGRGSDARRSGPRLTRRLEVRRVEPRCPRRPEQRER